MAHELERVRRNEHRTRSELVREALRYYIRAADARTVKRRSVELLEEQPTDDEVASIAVGNKEFRLGNFVTFNQLRHELDDRRQRPRAKKSQARSRR